jgi:hypothetical protein
LGLIGFVFLDSAGTIIFIILCSKEACIHSNFTEIGFVLHNLVSREPGFSADSGLTGQQALLEVQWDAGH